MNKIFLSLLLLLSAPYVFADYNRIVSLAPSATASLYELGIDAEIAGITVYCPKGKTKKEIVGTLLEPDFEKIISLKPDLIIASKEGNSKAAVEKLMRLGLNVYVMETSQSFEEICRNYLELAKKIGKEAEAQKIISEAKTTAESVCHCHGDVATDINVSCYVPVTENIQRVFWVVGAKPLYTAGKQSFVNDYNFYTKTENIYKDLNARYPQIGIEDVISKNPDIIILVNMGDITSSEFENWKKYKTLNAVKNNRIFMIDVNDIFTPTPKTFANGVKLLAAMIRDGRVDWSGGRRK